VRWLFVLALVACGDNRIGIPFDQLDDALDQARCERLVRCGMFTDAAACDGYFRKRPDRDLAAAVKGGLVTYSGPAAEDCVAALAAQSCDTSSRDARTTPPACKAMFHGSGLPGETCSFDEECASGSCDNPNCGELCCHGTCRALESSEVGEPCDIDADCGRDLFCGKADAICHPLGGDGAVCDDDNECDYGFACIKASPTLAGDCRAQPHLGETCLYQRCGDLNATCTDSTCVALGLPGDPCIDSSECSPFAECDTEAGRCIATPRLGEACSFGCAGEAWCREGTCVEPQQNAAACTADSQCLSLFCEEGVIFDDCADKPLCF
jgi:hypothetical protein